MTAPAALSLYSSILESRHAEASFAVDADTMAFMLAQAAHTAAGLDGRARVVASGGDAAIVAACGALGERGHDVMLVGGEGEGARWPLPAESPLARERFLVIESPSLALLVAGRPEAGAEGDPTGAAQRFEGVWSFDPGVVARALDVLGEAVGPIESLDDDAPTATPRLDLLASLFARIIRRMEDQKGEIIRVLEEFDAAGDAAGDLEAWRDPESWLPGRELFVERLDDAVRRANLGGQGFCLAIVSLRGFDATTQGESLRGLGSAIAHLTRARDFVGHLGGGRFGVAAVGADAAGGEVFARRLLATLRAMAMQLAGGAERPLCITVAPCGEGTTTSGGALLDAVEQLHDESMRLAAEVRVVE